jgi:isocitrate dehydrogenase
MLDHMGWKEAAQLIRINLQETIRSRTVTYDLARQIEDAAEMTCSAFGDAIADCKISDWE